MIRLLNYRIKDNFIFRASGDILLQYSTLIHINP